MIGKIEQDANFQKVIDDVLLDCPDFVNGWVINMQASRKTQSTCTEYLRIVSKFLRDNFENPKNVKPSDITSEMIEKYLVNKRTIVVNGNVKRSSDSIQATTWYAINSLFKYLKKIKKIDENPVSVIDAPPQHDRARIQEEAVYISPRQMKLIINQAAKEKNVVKRNRNVAIIRMLASTGIRKSAFLNITLDDVDLENKTVRVLDKGEKYSNKLLGDDTVEALKNWLDVRDEYNKTDSKYLFLSDHGERISETQLFRITSKISNDAIGIKLSPHKFRAFYGTTIYNKTGDIILTKNAMGHSNVNTTQIYIRKSKDEIKKTVDIIESVLK